MFDSRLDGRLEQREITQPIAKREALSSKKQLSFEGLGKSADCAEEGRDGGHASVHSAAYSRAF